ncbi:hypothetical protein HAX54_000725 [Datura stramonium]|uniref:RING-type E3 ubiquitin transferase n=1 Tax=Datura stramonium TaxID=4076 RepID=A0ABS8T2E7_DATST|nr:hypothetical protein [Datura stramonium]
MSNSHSHFSPDNYHDNYPRSQQAYRRHSLRFTTGPYDHSYGRRHVRTSVDEPYISRHQGIITPHNYQSVASSTNEIIDDHYVTRDPFELITRFLDCHREANYMEEKEEDCILEYFKIRTHCVVALKDGVNNPTKAYEEICAICQVEFDYEETIGTLGCEHEYHTCCIKQCLLRKKDCPMCRASVLPFTST